jgi:hypothetical protein
MPLGPNRAPGRYEVPVSNGAPEIACELNRIVHPLSEAYL